MIETNPYQAYSDANMSSSSPLHLVVALYEGALDSIAVATACLESGDIWGRSKSINKTISILTELTASLDHERGGEISQTLKRLYSYMQIRVLEAHSAQNVKPLKEVGALLKTLLEGWQTIAKASPAREENMLTHYDSTPTRTEYRPVEMYSEEPSAMLYNNYFAESSQMVENRAYSF